VADDAGLVYSQASPTAVRGRTRDSTAQAAKAPIASGMASELAWFLPEEAL
jgi:hypothetical protein